MPYKFVYVNVDKLWKIIEEKGVENKLINGIKKIFEEIDVII